eukprot:323954_1
MSSPFLRQLLLIINIYITISQEYPPDDRNAFNRFHTKMNNVAKRLSEKQRRNLITNPGTWEAQDIQDMLDAHNDFRRETAKGLTNASSGGTHPYATNMNYLFWDSALEQVASDWVSGCHLEHN